MASAIFYTKLNDLQTPLECYLEYADGTPINLTGVVGINFIYTYRVTGAVQTRPAVVVDAATGEVRVSRAVGDYPARGEYEGEFEIDYGGDVKLTVPNTEEHVIVRVARDRG